MAVSTSILDWLRPSGQGVFVPMVDRTGYAYDYISGGDFTFADGHWGVITYFRSSFSARGWIITRFSDDPSTDWIVVDPLAATSGIGQLEVKPPTPLVYGDGTWAFVVEVADYFNYTTVTRIYYSSTPEDTMSWQYVNLSDYRNWSDQSNYDEFRLGYHNGQWALAHAWDDYTTLDEFGSPLGRYTVSFSNSVAGPYTDTVQIATDGYIGPAYTVIATNREWTQHQIFHDGVNWVAVVGTIFIGGIGASAQKVIYRRSNTGTWSGPILTDIRSTPLIREVNGYWLVGSNAPDLLYFTPGSSTIQSFTVPYTLSYYGQEKYAQGNGYWLTAEEGGPFNYAPGSGSPSNLDWNISYYPVDLGFESNAVSYLDIMYGGGYFALVTADLGEIRYNNFGTEVYYPLRMSQRNDIYGVVQRSPRMNNSTGYRSSSPYTSNRIFGNGETSYDPYIKYRGSPQ